MTFKFILAIVFASIFIIPVIVLLILFIIRGLMIRFNINNKKYEAFCCKIGWHWKTITTDFDDCSTHGRCLSCKQDGMFDSNGDFFASSKK